MMADAISRNRKDGSLVCLITPMNNGEATARSPLLGFTQIAFPKIDEAPRRPEQPTQHSDQRSMENLLSLEGRRCLRRGNH